MTNPEQDTDRAAFEKWYRENGYYHDTASERKELMDEAWQAAKADSLAMQDAFEQVCEAIEEKNLRIPYLSIDNNFNQTIKLRDSLTEKEKAALAAAAPYRKTGV